MVAPRRKNLITSRRRVDDDGEEEDGSVAAGVEDDSLSEGSIISDADDDADAEGSDASDRESIERRNVKVKTLANGHIGNTRDLPQKSTVASEKASFSAIMNDTEAMMNGLKFSGDVDEGEEIDFDDMGKQTQEPPAAAPVQEKGEAASLDTLGEKRRREHEEYRKKRDADPAFVPNRGGFFMHDHRSSAPGQNGFRPFGRGRGRGRAGPSGPFPPVGYVPVKPIYPSCTRLTNRRSGICRNLLDQPMPLGHTIYTRLLCKKAMFPPLYKEPTKAHKNAQDHRSRPSRLSPRTDRFREPLALEPCRSGFTCQAWQIRSHSLQYQSTNTHVYLIIDRHSGEISLSESHYLICPSGTFFHLQTGHSYSSRGRCDQTSKASEKPEEEGASMADMVPSGVSPAEGQAPTLVVLIRPVWP